MPEDIAEMFMSMELEAGFTVRDALRLCLAAVTGTSDGVGTPAERFASVAGLVQRIVANFDNLGNRAGVTLDPS